MSAVEFRLVWRRDGQRKRTKLYQDRGAAERWALILTGPWRTVAVLGQPAPFPARPPEQPAELVNADESPFRVPLGDVPF